MSDWKEKLKQMKDRFTQPSGEKAENKHTAPVASENRTSNSKTSPPVRDDELFLATMKQEGVKPIPEFIAMIPEHGAVKRVVLKRIDLSTTPPAKNSIKHHVPVPRTRQEKPQQAFIRKAVSSVLPPEIPAGKNRVTIGIDFGTSTTKVCARARLGSDDVPIYRLDISDNSDAFEGLNPSLISIDREALYFADHTQKGVTIPHIKVCLACEGQLFSPQECLWAEACPINTCGSGLTAADLATLYLSWVMHESRKRLPDALKKADGFVFNLGVPVKHLDDSPLRAVFEKVTYFAWRLSEGVSQGLSIAQGKAWLDVLKRQSGNVPPPEDRMVQICPESSAAIVSFVNSNQALPGLYCLCDIGAWTSDMSVFRMTDVESHETAINRLSFYASGVTRRACEEIDTRIVRCLAELWGLDPIKDFLDSDILTEIRSVREHQKPSATFSVLTENGRQKDRKVPTIAPDYARNVVAEAVGRYFLRIIKQAYSEKEPIPDRWMDVALVMTGGGSRDGIFEKIFTDNCGCHFNKILLNVNAIKNAPKEQHFRFAVAAGLSYPLATWPEQLLPSEVDAWVHRAAKTIPGRDEQYPK